MLKRCLYALSEESELRPFALDDINAVLFNRHQSIGCSLDAPLRFVGWQSQAQWYELFKDEPKVFLPQSITFTNGGTVYAIVIIDGCYELRVWKHGADPQRQKHHWFDHEPIVYSHDLNALKESFGKLLTHIYKEDRYEATAPKFD